MGSGVFRNITGYMFMIKKNCWIRAPFESTDPVPEWLKIYPGISLETKNSGSGHHSKYGSGSGMVENISGYIF
jgi:hypothetical protein